MTDYHCWRCGATLEDLILPVSRREECRACRAEIHACRMCVNWDPKVSDQCREDRAEPPSDKTTANFCDYFKPDPEAYQGSGHGESDQRSELEALFGSGPDEDGDAAGEDGGDKRPGNPLDDLFDL